GSFVYQGAYVLHVNTEEMEVRGRITHQDNTTNMSTEPIWYRWEGTDHVVRSLYINTTLCTISEGTVKMHALSDLTETGIVFLSPPPA
ncbi:MAG: beta-propeller domain-containing protein, partial [Thermoplasmatota archaeon]